MQSFYKHVFVIVSQKGLEASLLVLMWEHDHYIFSCKQPCPEQCCSHERHYVELELLQIYQCKSSRLKKVVKEPVGQVPQPPSLSTSFLQRLKCSFASNLSIKDAVRLIAPANASMATKIRSMYTGFPNAFLVRLT